MTLPVVSVILPTYDRAHLLGRAISSVLVQTLASWELIVVDDASTDDTAQVVAGVGDPRVVYTRMEGNAGVSAARNAGLDLARGRFVSFLDSDDEYLPSKLERQSDLLGRCPDNIGAVECGMRLVRGDRARLIGPTLQGKGYEEFLRFEDGGILGTLLLRRELAAELRFDEALPSREDSDFLLRLLRRSAVVFIDEPLVVIHNPPGPRLSAAVNLMRGLEGLIRKYGDELRERPTVRASWNHRLAFFYIQTGDLRGARRALFEAIKARPWNLVRWVLLGATLFGDGPFSRVHTVYLRLGRVRQRLRDGATD